MFAMSAPAAQAESQDQLPRRRKCRPGYKSRSKLLRSANRLQTFLTNKIKSDNISLKSENIKLKQDLKSSFNEHKEFFNSKHRQIMSQFKETC